MCTKYEYRRWLGYPGRMTREQYEELEERWRLYKLFQSEEGFEGWEGYARKEEGAPVLDKIILREGILRDGRVFIPHEKGRNCQFNLRIDVIARRCRCTLAQAKRLVESWVILEPDRKTQEKFIEWVRKAGVKPAIAYFEKLAKELAFVEGSADPDAEVSYNFNPVGWHPLG